MGLFKAKWKVAKSGFPYKEGYGTYKTDFWGNKRTILDTGLSYEQAVRACKELNSR